MPNVLSFFDSILSPNYFLYPFIYDKYLNILIHMSIFLIYFNNLNHIVYNNNFSHHNYYLK
jgi:hypothetical protein